MRENIQKFAFKVREQSRLYDPNTLSDYHLRIISDKSCFKKGCSSEEMHLHQAKNNKVHNRGYIPILFSFQPILRGYTIHVKRFSSRCFNVYHVYP